jgi:hypothetical protein
VTAPRQGLLAPLTAAALIALQVCSNAVRDGLFLTHFAVPRLPYLMAVTALLAFPAARITGRLSARFGPARVAPALFAAAAVLFAGEWMLLGPVPRAAAIVLYLHASVLGAIGISAFWSLLNERFDPHSARRPMARVAAAAAAGGLVGGLAAERATFLLGADGVLLLMAAIAGACVAGALVLGRAAPQRVAEEWPDAFAGWHHIRGQPLLRGLALVIALSAMVAALADYLLKGEAVAYFGKGEPLVRFFGLFYAGTALSSALIQSALGSAALARLGLGGSVASHPIAVGAAAVVGLVLPAPWRGALPRALDQSVRNSIFRAGYELHYTPLPPSLKRAAKPIVDVACDSAGKGAGAALILLLVAAAPDRALTAVTLAAVLAAFCELRVARRLRTGYVAALEGGLKRQAGELETVMSYVDFTGMEGVGGVDPEALRRALGPEPAAMPADPVARAVAELRSGDAARIQSALRELPRDPVVIAALVPLLARRDVVRAVVDALVSFGARAAGEMASALADPATSPVVRRRLPLALRACPSPIARDGLVAGLDARAFDIRLRCGRALLALTDAHPELACAFPSARPDIGRDVWGDGSADTRLRREHLFNLLALAYEREPMRVAARSLASMDERARGTALEYLETVLPPALFAGLRPILEGARAEPRDEVMGGSDATTVSRAEILRQLETEDGDAG